MKSATTLRRIRWHSVIIATALFASIAIVQAQIGIFDQNGDPIPDAEPPVTGQIIDVAVGPGGNPVFSPSTVIISAGDTVRWTWAGKRHSVTSGNPCTSDWQFCSPDDINCGSGTLSAAGTIYQHTFNQAGMYSYYSASHCALGMTGTVNVTAAPALQLVSAVSRLDHGVQMFDIDMPLSGTPGVECRRGPGTGDYPMVFTFTNNVVSGSASVTSGVGTVSGTPTFSGNTMTVNLTGIGNIQTISITLSNVTDVFGQTLSHTSVNMSILIGDTNGSRIVNSSDIGQTKSRLGQSLTSSNFRSDITANGSVNGNDVALAKSHVGESVPSAPR